MQNNFRKITAEELKNVNSVLEPKFGGTNRIVSGTCEKIGRKKKRCNIVFSDSKGGSVYKSSKMLYVIGSYVKSVLLADEVYYFGVKIA